MKETSKSISAVIPTYNEAENIKIIIDRVEDTLKGISDDIELIIVDDSSPDGTALIAREYNKKYGNIKVIVRKKKAGIGAALKEGYNNAKNELIVSTDADFHFDPEDMLNLFRKLDKGYDLVVGSRYKSNHKYKKKGVKNKIKSVLSTMGNVGMRTISGVPMYDFSANFRAMRKKVWDKIKVKDNDNSMLFEMIIKAHYSGFKVSNVPIHFRDRIYGNSKLNIYKEASRFLYKLSYHSFKIRILKKMR
jgi:glycosyltransferase involved in cell wall biosynthesis